MWKSFCKIRFALASAPMALNWSMISCAHFVSNRNGLLRAVRNWSAWLLEAAGKPLSELTRADFDAIRGRLRKRLKPQAT
jgi:hypothetical protein